MNDEHSAPTNPGPHLVKVRIKLSDEDRAHGVEAENLWAEHLGDGYFRIDSIPFYVYGISYRDIVRAEMEGANAVYRSVAKRSGHSTYRVLVTDPMGYESASFKNLWSSLEKLGCSSEIAKKRWIAIDVPSSTDVHAVYGVLEAGEENGIWSFEEGHCGHAI